MHNIKKCLQLATYKTGNQIPTCCIHSKSLLVSAENHRND